MAEVFTLDINFDNVENLNGSVENTKLILEELKTQNKITGYYIMRYVNGQEIFLGVKILFNGSEQKDNTLSEIKDKLQNITGYKDIKQEKSEGNTNNLSLICSISMEFRNKIWELLGRKPTDEEFIYIIHYLANPLLLGNDDELRIFEQRIKQLKGER